MAFSLFLVGQLSMMGLISTSISPPPRAYMTTEARSPVYASGSSSGNTASPSSPPRAASAPISAPHHTSSRVRITMAALYPILSMNPADSRSTNSWMPKLIVISMVIRLRGI